MKSSGALMGQGLSLITMANIHTASFLNVIPAATCNLKKEITNTWRMVEQK
jgi:hypothetical protein